jgi:branched-chain amino acid aminotransferase
MTLVIWAEGRLVGSDEAALSAVDHGITVGDGVFETCTVLDGRVFALTRHLARLARSARGLGLEAPDEQKVRDGVAAVLAAATHEAGAMAPESHSARSPWPRNERSPIAGLKTTSYAENVVALADAKAKGADESILPNTVGALCEGTGSNVFVERGGELLTPHLESGCLAGITRALVLEWGAEAGLPVREAALDELPFSVLDDVTAGRAQLALTSSGRNVQPVTWLDGAPVAAGEITLAVREVFEKNCRERLDP